jgi:hypothetical protein
MSQIKYKCTLTHVNSKQQLLHQSISPALHYIKKSAVNILPHSPMTRTNNFCVYKLQTFCASQMGIKLDPVAQHQKYHTTA